MKLHSLHCSISVGSFVAFWSVCSLIEGMISGIHQYTSGLVLHPFIQVPPTPLLLPQMQIPTSCSSLLIYLWRCHFITRERAACSYCSHHSAFSKEGFLLVVRWFPGLHTALSPCFSWPSPEGKLQDRRLCVPGTWSLSSISPGLSA